MDIVLFLYLKKGMKMDITQQQQRFLEEKFGQDFTGAEILGCYTWAPHIPSGQIYASGGP